MGADATLPAVTEGPLSLWWEGGGRGAGRSVVLVPDAHRCVAAWPAALVEGLSAAGNRPFLVDLRDQGRSPWLTGVDGRYAVADVAADLAAVLGHGALDARPHPPLVVGHGFGATVALELAGRWPALVGGLVLVGGTGWFVDPTLPGPDEPTAVGLIWRSRLAATAGGGAVGVSTAGAVSGGAVSGGARSLAPTLARELRLLTTPADDPGPVAALAEVGRWLAWGFNPTDGHGRAWLAAPPLWGVVAARRHPLVVVHGGGDPLVPLAHGERLAAEAGASLRVVGDVGHALGPQLVAAVLAAVTDLARAG
jgi:pimeloyl-ACP methyl ester carboxylesterase